MFYGGFMISKHCSSTVQSIGALSLNVYREDECAKILLNGYFSLNGTTQCLDITMST
jgi:hypothetical protein